MATNITPAETPTQFNHRIGVDRTRKPFTPEAFDSYRPAPVSAAPVADAIPNKLELFQILGQGSGLPVAAAQRLAHYITILEARIAALETAQHTNPSQIGVERR